MEPFRIKGVFNVRGMGSFFLGDWLLEPLWVTGTAGFNVNPRIMSCFFKVRLINLRGSPQSDVSQLNRTQPYFQPTRALFGALSRVLTFYQLYTLSQQVQEVSPWEYREIIVAIEGTPGRSPVLPWMLWLELGQILQDHTMRLQWSNAGHQWIGLWENLQKKYGSYHEN